MRLSATLLLLLSPLVTSQSDRLRATAANGINLPHPKRREAKSSKNSKKSPSSYFNRISNFFICSQDGSSCESDVATSAEIVAATEDGMMLVYTDSNLGGVGFVDIADPTNPVRAGFFDVGGEPTSVAVRGQYAAAVVNTSNDYVDTSGVLLLVDLADRTLVQTIPLGGQPDSVAWSHDGKYIVVAIENERDEDLNDGRPPQLPAGFVVVIDASDPDPANWVKTDVTITGLEGVDYPEDPEPEYVSINKENVAVVTLQENNALVLIDLATKTVIDSFSAGEVELTNIDVSDDGLIDQSVSLKTLREPDGVVWMDNEHFITANEGDMDGGSRGFTIFHKNGTVVYEANSTLDHIAASIGHYPDKRSDNKGNEPENVAVGVLNGKPVAFINSERSSVVFVYDISNPAKPEFIQVLPAGLAPEGATFIPSRNLLVVAAEEDDRDIAARAVISIYQPSEGKQPNYPYIMSSWSPSENNAPIAWGALSGLSPGKEKYMLYSIEDSFYKRSRIFEIDVKDHPAMIKKAITIMDSQGVLEAAHPGVFVNPDKTVNLDQEGIAMDSKGYFWIASEGSGTAASGTPNILVKVDKYGVIHKVVDLPADIAAKQLRWGLEGVAFWPSYDALIVCLQRPWNGEDHPFVLGYSITMDAWLGYLRYPLDNVTSINGGWIGLSDISIYGEWAYLIERDNQGGPDAAVKKVYKFKPSDFLGGGTGEMITKTLAYDMLPKLEEVSQGLVPEKIEGLAVTKEGMYIVNDNDGVDDYNGATYLIFVEPGKY